MTWLIIFGAIVIIVVVFIVLPGCIVSGKCDDEEGTR